MTTIKTIGLVIAGVIVSVMFSVTMNGGEEAVSGVYSNVTKSFSEGITVDGVTVIDGDRNVSTQGFTQGGGVLNVIDANGGTYTLTEAQMLASNVFEMNAGGAGQAVIALTLPATSTMKTLIPTAGDMREWMIDASALSAATTTTITLGTGVNLIAVTANDDVIDGAEFARLTCWREEDTDVSCIVSELLVAD